MRRKKKYNWGSLITEQRKGRNGESYEVYVYRYFENQMDEDGHRKRLKAILGRTDEMTEDEALFEIEHLRMGANAEHPQHVKVTMRGLIQRYIQEILQPCFLPLGGVQSKRARMSDAGAKVYRWALKTIIEPKWGAYDVRDFEQIEIRTAAEQWLPTVACSDLQKIYNVMRQVFKWGVKWGYIEFNPLADDLVELPPGATTQQDVKKPTQLTPAQFFVLDANLRKLPRLAVAIEGRIGSRRSEPFGLKWQDIDFNEAVVRFKWGFVAGRITRLKTKASRSVWPLPEEVMTLLREWRKETPYNRPEDWVFASPYTKGKRPYWPDALMKRRIRPVALRLGLPKISWNSFRHSVAEWAKRALKLQEAKELLRHEKESTTSEIYGGMSLKDKRSIQQQLGDYMRQQAKADGWSGKPLSTKKTVKPMKKAVKSVKAGLAAKARKAS
jgi:integrase